MKKIHKKIKGFTELKPMREPMDTLELKNTISV